MESSPLCVSDAAATDQYAPNSHRHSIAHAEATTNEGSTTPQHDHSRRGAGRTALGRDGAFKEIFFLFCLGEGSRRKKLPSETVTFMYAHSI